MVKQGHEVYIVTSKMERIPDKLTNFFGKKEIDKADKDYMEKTGVKIIRLPILNYVSGRAIFTNYLFQLVDALYPDILYVHGNDTLTGIRYILKVDKLNYPIITDSHMLEMASVNPLNKVFRLFYKTYITPKIIKHKIKVIRTQNDDYVEKYLGIPLSQSPLISVGSDTMLFHPDKNIRHKFRKEYKISENDFVVIYAGKLDESKGGKILAKAFLKKINNSRNKNVILIVVGNTVGEYGKQVEAIFSKSENRIIRFRTQKYTDLSKFYQAADLAVFPKQCSLSFYDVQACGLPVIAEDNNINIDRLSHNNGFTFKSDNVDDFRRKIKLLIEMDKDQYNKISHNALKYIQNNFDYQNITKQYLDLIENEVRLFRVKK
jgi:glycosyltransferase involved in cell wall biosynthesis